MNAQELKRWLAKQGCTFETKPPATATSSCG